MLEDYRRSVLVAAFCGDLTADWREDNPNGESGAELLTRIRLELRRRWEEAELTKMLAKGEGPADRKWTEKYEEPEPVDAQGLAELPEGWCWASWAQVGLCQNGRPFPSSEYVTEGVRLLRPGNLKASGTVEWKSENTKFLPERFAEENPEHVVTGDQLVMNLTAQSLKDEFLGRVCMSSPGERCLLNQRIARLTPVILAPRFCLWLFKAPLVRAYIDEIATGSLIQHMFTSQVERFLLPIPPPAEQLEIVRQIECLMKRATIAHEGYLKGIAELGDMDRSILTSAFRGALVPQDPTDEPASALLERIRAERVEAAAKPHPERPKAPVRRPAMSNHDMKDRIRAAIRDQAFDRFSFRDLMDKVPGNYDALKDELFALLDEKPRVVCQVYDKQAGAMRLQRVRP